MKNKTKGFTLIELLATIVILAIIALIATPIVLNLINTARKGAFARSAEGVLSASKLYYSSSLLENITPGTINFKCNNKECITDKGTKLDIDGNMGTGSITVKEDGKIFFTLTNNKYCAVKYENNKNIILKDGNCSNIDLTNDTTPPIIKNVTVNTTTSSITIVVNAEDNESGIHHYEYSIDNGQTYEKGNTNTKTINNLEKKDYKVKVKVYNGTYGKDNYSDNTGMAEYEVKDLVQLKDMDFPEIKVTPEEWSTSKTVEIDYKGALIQEYSIDGGTTYIKYEGPFTITENMTIVAKASDGTNNITKSTQVTKIDTEKPTISINSGTKVVDEDTVATDKIYTATFGPSSGTVNCINNTTGDNVTKYDDLYLGLNNVTCTATNSLGVTSSSTGDIILNQKFKFSDKTSNFSLYGSQNLNDDVQYGPYKRATKGNYKITYYGNGFGANNQTLQAYQNVNPGIEFMITNLSYDSKELSYNIYVDNNLTGSGLEVKLRALNNITIDSIKIEYINATTTYQTGDAITLGGYKWHVIGDTGTEVTLLMDAGQLGSNSNMAHCTKDTDASTDCGVDSTGKYYVYSWDKSKIRTYLNGEFLTNLEGKIGNEIVSTSICADPSRGDMETTYGGYLMSELNVLGKASNCSKQVSDKVRLISYSEYYNMTPYYTNIDANYPNVENITKISSDGDYASWLYCNSNVCGDRHGYWWTMSSYSGSQVYNVGDARDDYGSGYLSTGLGEYSIGIRPVVTIVK